LAAILKYALSELWLFDKPRALHLIRREEDPRILFGGGSDGESTSSGKGCFAAPELIRGTGSSATALRSLTKASEFMKPASIIMVERVVLETLQEKRE